MLVSKPQEKWYFKLSTLIISFVSIGPFALPLVWFNPRFSQKAKIIISALVIILSLYMGVLLFNSLKAISRYYQSIF